MALALVDACLNACLPFCRSRKQFPCAADQYELVKEIGKGACGTVCLLKLDLDKYSTQSDT